MNVRKAVITAAARTQRTLPLQAVVDRDGVSRTVLEMLVRDAVSAGAEKVCVVIAPGDHAVYAQAAGASAGLVGFVEQAEPNGYGDALLAASAFTGEEPFLHFVGDHLFLTPPGDTLAGARALVELASRENCAVSAVQATREHALPYYGTIGGKLVHGRQGLYEVEAVLEKPTPTEAEQALLVPGLRSGYYLCFVGMHVLTAGVMSLLRELHSGGAGRPTLSDALALLPRRERYLALESRDIRYNVGVKHGLLLAQLYLALSGPDRDEVLTSMVELLASNR
jgi:UTP--glucose-1-phosphate uridylyltransferase